MRSPHRTLALRCCLLTPRAALLSLWVLRSLHQPLCIGLGVLDQAVQQLLAVAEAAPEVKRTLFKKLPLLLRAVVHVAIGTTAHLTLL